MKQLFQKHAPMGLVFILALVAVIETGLLIGGYIYYQSVELMNDESANVKTLNTKTSATDLLPSSMQIFRNKDIGIEFNYPADFGTPEVKYFDINSSIRETTKIYSGKAVEIRFKPNVEKYGISFLRLSAYSKDFKRFLDTPFYGLSPLKSVCANQLQYDKKGNVCVIRNIGNLKTIVENLIDEEEGSIAFINKYKFNNPTMSDYTGLSLDLFYKDIGDDLNKNYSCCADPEAEVKIAKTYILAKNYSQQIIDRNNLSSIDLNGLDKVEALLASIKFTQ